MTEDTELLPTLLLGPDEPPPFELVNAGGAGSAVLLCDHACNRIPRRLGTLGLTPQQLVDHISWDPGAAGVARLLSALLNSPLVLSSYSRLVIDCNRPLPSEESITRQSSGIKVPGNCGLTTQDRYIRINTLFRPYHQAIGQLLDACSHRPTVLLSIHSFTPSLNNSHRPWHIGVSYGRDRRLAELLLEALSQHGDIIVGDNKPYPIEEHIDYSLPLHGEVRGLPHVMFEIRQDEIQTPQGVEAWAALLKKTYRIIEAEALRLCCSRFVY